MEVADLGHLRRCTRKQLLDHAMGLLVVVAAVLPGLANAQAGPSMAALYRLSDRSSYQEGCFDPCLCPILDPRPVLGTFRLRFIESNGLFDRYRVEDVHWQVLGRDPELRVDGSGTYTVGAPGPGAVRQNRLELDLQVGASPIEHFDSGWVIGPSLPHIQITVSMNGIFCYDRVFVVDADPVPDSQLQPYALVDGSSFQRGCFDPCDCPIGEEQPMTGAFSLLPLSDNGVFALYGMVDVQWKVQGSALPPDPFITGVGSYTIGGEFAIQQRMEATLEIGDEPPASFDSGRVIGGGGFPDSIDVEISQNGKVCFDTVMHVVAKARPIPEPGAALQLVAGVLGLAGISRWRRGAKPVPPR